MICGQIGAEPWYGTNSRFLQGLTTSPHPSELAGSHLVSIPRSMTAQRARHATFDLVDKPQRTRCSHEQTKRIGTDDALPLPALSLPQTIEGVGVTDGNCHRPAVALLVQDVLETQGKS